jgi:hypothetical protein
MILKAVYVEWRDSCYLGGWRTAEDFEPCIIKTIGWLVSSAPDHVVISSHVDEVEEESVHSPMSIPRSCIIAFYELDLR